MKEKLRQTLLAQMGWSNRTKQPHSAAEVLLVYVPDAVSAALRPYPGRSWAQSIEWCSAHGATAPRIKDNQVIMTWPQRFWDTAPNVPALAQLDDQNQTPNT